MRGLSVSCVNHLQVPIMISKIELKLTAIAGHQSDDGWPVECCGGGDADESGVG